MSFNSIAPLILARHNSETSGLDAGITQILELRNRIVPATCGRRSERGPCTDSSEDAWGIEVGFACDERRSDNFERRGRREAEWPGETNRSSCSRRYMGQFFFAGTGGLRRIRRGVPRMGSASAAGGGSQAAVAWRGH